MNDNLYFIKIKSKKGLKNISRRQINKMIELQKSGLSYDEIGKLYKVDGNTVYKTIKDYKEGKYE
ncbi:helix-turn-helix domain-containing protein [Caldisalinibacter kiritimatiensis]|uniref:Resolvase HTH domain-containing protein n=1 Tax=Caldisalinibacter kiritimatiensis TaxID=1304284 RepID=R1CDK2_9FIRM|nr:helix-turn-helix domain-containing protein [Caldisalinibacter kiritimatiensis]EOD00370.1 hypothetical protein L21TH_1584 [Caldisalinibacter kiritimatiensis]